MRPFLAVLVMMVSLPPALADRIVLIYGDVLEGKVIAETGTTVTIEGPFGQRIMNKSDIREVVADPNSGPVAPAVPGQPAPELPPQEVPVAGGGGAWPAEDGSAAAPSAPGSFVPPPPSQPAVSSFTPNALPSGQMPTAYDIIRANAEMQSRWRDLEIGYSQRAFANGQSTETRTIARIIPPNYMRAKMITVIAPNQQMPQGGEVEYDVYRARDTLWQVAKLPNQPIQYLKMDASRIERQAMARSMESFQYGFAGTATDETLLQPFARNTQILGSEVIEGHDCWVLETRYTPEVIDTQCRRYPPDIQATVRQQLAQTIGHIRNWIGKDDLIQRRMESFLPNGTALLAMAVTTVQPNKGLDAQALRMKVPKGTTWVDITDMVAGNVNQLMSGQAVAPSGNAPQYSGGQQQQQQMQMVPQGYGQAQGAVQPSAPQGYYQQQPSAYGAAPQQQQGGYPVQGQQMQAYSAPYAGQQQMQQQMAPQGYGQAQGAAQPYQQNYIQQGMPMQAQPQMQQQQPSGSGGGFLSRLFGSGRQQQQQQQPQMPMGGYSQSGNQTMMVPMMNGQPQFPTPPR
ncbi:MAG: hypothetical protein DYH02_01505 [Candidatus Omnitrophica bacterium COP1]|nr:hypothetical protein [Candidatus Omnitrophica bacterium COP1]